MNAPYVIATAHRMERLCNEALLETPLDPSMAGVRQRLIEMRDEAFTLGAHVGSHEDTQTHGHPRHDGNPGTCAGCHAEHFGAEAGEPS